MSNNKKHKIKSIKSCTFIYKKNKKPQNKPYAGAQNKTALANLLAPVQRAAEKSQLARELLESRRLFQALTWTPRDAYRFLRDIPSFEESGLLVRVPDWWKAGRPARAQVQVRIGNAQSGLFGLESLMDFSAEAALDGQPLTPAEWNEVMSSQDNLVRLKGQWVEIDRARLEQVLEHWRRIQKQGGAISFLEGMRLLAGLGSDAPGDPLADPETRVWSRVVPGNWLGEMLTAMRDPSALAGFDPNRDLRTTLRGYQRDGVHWLWFMTRLGLGACLADDMGLGKTVQTIAMLLQIKREASEARTQPELPGSIPASTSSPSVIACKTCSPTPTY
jgi:hypothetical protein